VKGRSRIDERLRPAAQNSERRLEFIDGVIVAMAGGSYEHNAIAGHFAGLFAARVTPECLYYTPDRRKRGPWRS
jgi:Uma2 family endonuclease